MVVPDPLKHTLVITVDGEPPRSRLAAIKGRRARARFFAAYQADTWRTIESRVTTAGVFIKTQKATGTAVLTGPVETLIGLMQPGGALHGMENVRALAPRTFSLP